MKNLLKLPVLLLAVMLVASCGDSKKEEEKKLSPVEQAAADGKKAADIACEVVELAKEHGLMSDEVKEFGEKNKEFGEEIEEKYGDSGNASDEEKARFQKEYEAGTQDCI